MGTTGWSENIEKVNAECKLNDTSVFYASNFSIGMNITFALNEKLAKWMNELSEYEVNIDETHHIHKLDKPSGTAISLADGIINSLDRKTHWVNDGSNDHYLVKSAPIPVGSSLELIDGGAKIVVDSGDILKVVSDTASSIDTWVSCVDAIST